MNRLEQTAANCTLPLESDPELALDVRRELASHLEESAEALRETGMNAEESEAEAIRNFGSPQEIGDRLLDANFKRMRFRARLRRALLILLIPALLISVYCSLRLDLLAAAASFEKLGGPKTGFFLKILQKLRLPDKKEIFLVHGDMHRHEDANMRLDAARQRSIWESEPDNKAYLANYIIELFAKGWKNEDYLLSELRNAAKIDPDNALYPILEAGIFLKRGCKSERVEEFPAPPRITILNRVNFDRAMQLYCEALSKPYFRTYQSSLLAERLRALDYPVTISGRLQNIHYIAHITLPYLSLIRELGYAASFHGGELARKGKAAEAAIFFDSPPRLVRLLNDDNFTLIGILVANTVLQNAAYAAEQRGDNVRAAKFRRIGEPIAKWRQLPTKENARILRQHGGFASQRLLPVQFPFSAKELAPERHLSYLVIDSIGFMLLTLLIFIFMSIQGLWMLYLRLSGKHGYVLTLSAKDYRTIAIGGVILPLGLYLLWGNTELLSGRSYAPGENQLLNTIGIAYLLAVIPLIYGFLVKRALRRRSGELGMDKIPDAVKHLNVFFAWAILLVAVNATALPVTMLIERIEVARDTLVYEVSSAFFTPAEDRIAKELKAALAKELAKP